MFVLPSIYAFTVAKALSHLNLRLLRKSNMPESNVIKVTVNKKQHRVRTAKDRDGWIVAECLDVKGAHTQGKNLREATKNIKEAIELVLEVIEEEKAKKA